MSDTYKEFISSCKKGNLKKVSLLYENNRADFLLREFYYEGLKAAAQAGKTKVVTYLLNNDPSGSMHQKIQEAKSISLQMATAKGNIRLVKKIYSFVDKDNVFYSFRIAAADGKMSILRFLEDKCDPKQDDLEALRWASQNNQYAATEFLLRKMSKDDLDLCFGILKYDEKFDAIELIKTIQAENSRSSMSKTLPKKAKDMPSKKSKKM